MLTYINLSGQPVVLGKDHDAEDIGQIITGDLYPFQTWSSLNASQKSSTGVIISAQEQWDEIKRQLKNIPIAIKIIFDTMANGQGFSLANLLRKRYNYKGPICAAQNYAEEQVLLLVQCGFDIFELDHHKDSERIQMLLKQKTTLTTQIDRVA